MTVLLVAWIALLGADRVNLLGDRGPFVLTPFLVLTPIVVAMELRRRAKARATLSMPPGATAFLTLALALIGFAVGSVFVSRDLTSAAPRSAQLVLVVFGTFVTLLCARDRADFAALLARGARAGLLLFLAFDAAQMLALLNVLPATIPADPAVVRLAPYMYAGVVPRLSGMVVDSNRGGLLVVLFGALIAIGDRERARVTRWLALAAVLLVATLSRSAMLAAAGAMAVPLASGARAYAPRRYLAIASLLVATGTISLLVDPGSLQTLSSGLEPLVQRFTLIEGSSQDHLRLLARGFSTATATVATALHGIGYGSSHLALQDFFPGDRYGNFHSIYVGIFAESGVFALLTLLVLLGVPLFNRATPYRPLVAAVALFGMFYGALSEPAFWLAVVLAWVPPPSSSPPNAMAKATAKASTAPSSNCTAMRGNA